MKAEPKNFKGDSTIHVSPLQEKNLLAARFPLFRFDFSRSSDRLLGGCYLKVIELGILRVAEIRRLKNEKTGLNEVRSSRKYEMRGGL
jgi:hypothetical protein